MLVEPNGVVTLLDTVLDDVGLCWVVVVLVALVTGSVTVGGWTVVVGAEVELEVVVCC